MSLPSAAAAWASRPARGTKPSHGEGHDDDERAVDTREERAPAGAGDRDRVPRDAAERGGGALLDAGAAGRGLGGDGRRPRRPTGQTQTAPGNPADPDPADARPG